MLIINSLVQTKFYLSLSFSFFNASSKIIILIFFILFKLFYILIKKIIQFSYFIPNWCFNFIFLSQYLATLFLFICVIFILPKFVCFFNFLFFILFFSKNFRNRISLTFCFRYLLWFIFIIWFTSTFSWLIIILWNFR